MQALSQAILKTISFFDIFNYPLTLMEIWKWLYTDDTPINHGYNLNDIETALGQLSNKVQLKNGFYFLIGRESIVNQRLQRYNFAEGKYQKAIKFIKIFRFIPFIKMIAICNTLAYSNSSLAGDIDLFIIAKNQRLWLTRFLVVGMLKLLGQRPTAEKKQDAIDATFFLSEEHLNIEEIGLRGQGPAPRDQADIYLIYWIDQIVPIYDIDDTYQKFQEANGWIKKILPNSIGYQLNSRRVVNNTLLGQLVKRLIGYLTNWQFLENVVRKYQLKIMPQILKEMMNQDTRVVVNEKMLKFHRDDRRAEYREKFNKLNQSV